MGTHPRASPLFLYHHQASNAVIANGKSRIVSQKNVLWPLIPGQRCWVPRSGRDPPSQLEYGTLRYAVRSYQYSSLPRHESSLERGVVPATKTHFPSASLTWLNSLCESWANQPWRIHAVDETYHSKSSSEHGQLRTIFSSTLGILPTMQFASRLRRW